MKDRSDPGDILAVGIPNRAALIVSGFDPESGAMQLVRDLHFVLENGWRLGFGPSSARTPSNARPIQSATSPNATGVPAFVGRPMSAKFGGSCAVCRGPIAVGETILYNRDAKRAAHDRCGELSP